MAKNLVIQLPYKFTPRDYQYPVLSALDSGYDRALCVWHRRSGKDKVFLNHMIRKMYERVGNYYYFFPEFKQARKAIWEGKDKTGMPFTDHFPKQLVKRKNNTEMLIEMNNGSMFQLIGTDNFNAFMGTGPVGCVFSEYAIQDPNVYEYVRPMLRENKGWAIFNSTPRGMNHMKDLYDMALDNDKWFCELLTVNDTGGVITEEDLDDDRREGMTEEMINQEYYCSFEAGIPGAYYAVQMSLARDQGRISSIPHQGGVAVDTYWDLGYRDNTSIWFAQDVGREIHLIDYYENRNEGLEHFVRKLNEKRDDPNLKYTYGRHVLPHDGAYHQYGTGTSIQEIARSLGLVTDIARRPARKELAIEAVRNILRICYFDKDKCRIGISGLQSYRKKYDPEKKVFDAKPIHDWASHSADAISTLAISHRFTSLGSGNKSYIHGGGRIKPSAWT